MWKIKKMNELNAEEFYQLLKLRIDTFVVEQKRIYHELDKNDPEAFHVFFQSDDSNEVLAYARVFYEDNYVTFGRVVTSTKVRGSGLGSKLMEHILTLCEKEWPEQPIQIEAQEQVVGFYEKYDFSVTGEPFIFERTPHVEMVKSV